MVRIRWVTYIAIDMGHRYIEVADRSVVEILLDILIY